MLPSNSGGDAPRSGSCAVVAIGASAGGVEALQDLFRAMPADTGLAFVVLTHLGPDGESDLPTILGRVTTMPVTAVRDGAVVAPNHVHVLPNDGLLTIRDRCLRLQPQGPGPLRERLPIDVFFAALAEDLGEWAAGIVLSGEGRDGALGIRAIRQAGGLTFAQRANGTRPDHGSMPASAVATGEVDLSLPVEEMPARLAEFARFLESEDSVPHSAEVQVERAVVRQAITETLRRQVGHDFAGYKDATFLRRVRRRMHVRRIRRIADYAVLLQQDTAEVATLFRDLLIKVTGFFRNPEAFDALERSVIPEIFDGCAATDTVRIWVPGCATGEEAYSLAILMREHLATRPAQPRVQIFATDIDEVSLATARAGRYPAPLLAGVSPARLERHFTADGATFVVSKDIRELCVFSAHSLIRDPPFSRLDLISCRNLLIYLDGPLQERVASLFHFALRPGRFLLLGNSENVTRRDDLFAPLDKSQRIFRRRGEARSTIPHAMPGVTGPRAWSDARPGSLAPQESGAALRETVTGMVMDQFAPAHVVVDQDGDIVLQSGRLGRYLEPAAGIPSRHLQSMARRGLRMELGIALRETMETRRQAVRPRVQLRVEDRIQLVELVVAPVPGRDGGDPLFLVTFIDRGLPVVASGDQRSPPDGADASFAAMEAELRDTRERLRSTIEEYEAGVEDLRSVNEEMLSVNEELQSSNEELETGKEEQQTVNLELATKVEELDRVHADLRNLFDSTEIATIFLDPQMVIRSFTPAVTAIVNLAASDRGRSLSDFAANLDRVDLRHEIRTVLDGRRSLERRVTTLDGNVHYLMRILPYRSADGRADGVVLTFFDVSSVVQAELLGTLVNELNHRVRNMLQVVLSVSRSTLRHATSLEDFSVSFLGRIKALSLAHELVSRQGWKEVLLSDLVRQELEPHAETAERIILRGPTVGLRPRIILALGMVLHELATNAVKYGALSVPDGRVVVQWSVLGQRPERQLKLHWMEEGGPPVKPPSRRGFGSGLIERQLQHDLNGTIVTRFAAAGMQADISLPLLDRLPVLAPEAANPSLPRDG